MILDCETVALFSAHVPISASPRSLLKYTCTSVPFFPVCDVKDPIKIKFYLKYKSEFQVLIVFVSSILTANEIAFKVLIGHCLK